MPICFKSTKVLHHPSVIIPVLNSMDSSQMAFKMHENLLISRANTLVIASVWTQLINEFECICEGQAYWVCNIL